MHELIFKVLNMSITATFIALAVIFLRLLLRKAPKWISYALWSVVLFRLVCPFSFSSGLSLLGGIGVPTAENGVISYIPKNAIHMATPQVDLVIPDVNKAVNRSLPQGENQLVADPLDAPTTIMTFIWFLGVATMLVYSVFSYVLLKRRLSEATLLEGNVFETDAIISPCVCGLIKPRIYLPVGLLEADRGYVLLHERTHIRRWDYLIKPLAFLALSIHWFNPLIWLSFQLMSCDMEISCDERVVRELDQEGRAGYSAVLMRLATGRPILAGSPLAFGESGTKERVRNILNYKKPVFWVVAVTVIAVIFAAMCLLANPASIFNLDEHSISSATTHDFRRDESYTRELQEIDIEELASRLAIVSSTRRSDKYTGLTPLYSIAVVLDDGTNIKICGYSSAGDMLDITYKSTTYCVSDSSFASYVDRICAGENVTSAINMSRPASGVYSFDECLYMNPASSYYPFEGTGQLYLCDLDSFTIVNKETKKIQESYSLIDWQAKTVNTNDWNSIFRNEAVDISSYQSKIEYDIGGNYRLYQMDGEVWLSHFSGDILWSLYQLQKTDLFLSDIVGHTGSSIPENETLRVDSPDGTYRAEAYGTNKGITAAGLYPYDGLRLIRNSDETIVWSGDGYYRVEFLWSNNSKYVAVYREARIYGECFVVAADTGKVIKLPNMDTISAQLGASSQPAANRPDPIFRAMEWVNDTTIRINYRWTAQEGEKEVSGTYEYDIINGNIVSNTSKISDSPG